MGRASWSGFVRAVKRVITFVFSHVGLCCAVAAYAVAGAFLFQELEGKYVEEHHDSAISRQRCLDVLFNITVEYSAWREGNSSMAWVEAVGRELESWESNVAGAVGNQTYDQGPDEQRERWSIIGSLFYCVTVITTIGYGHVSPRTWEGKMVTIVYAVFGIPLMLLCLTNIGNSMATSFRFMYHRICCGYCRKAKEEEAEAEANANLQNKGPATPAPYTPPPQYKPKRNMLISPPISATIHRGSDNPLVVPDFTTTASTTTGTPSGPTSTISGRPTLRNLHHQLHDPEANRILAECTAYSRRHVPGYVRSHYDPHDECHDYDHVPYTPRPSPGGSSRPSPASSPSPAAPSSPRSRNGPDVWLTRRDDMVANGPSIGTVNGGLGLGAGGLGIGGGGTVNDGPGLGPHIVVVAEVEASSSGQWTRPSSPASTSSLPVSTSAPAASAAMSYLAVDHDDDRGYTPRGYERPPRSPGKTLVVYNTMSGDALLEQSKIARKMALMNKGGFGTVRADATTVFTDPISGQAVDGDMLGLNYRPIPPDNSEAENRVPIPIVLAFVASYLGVGALLFGWLEDWTLLNSCYFCFITLSTIGFGDFVPGKSLGYETQEAQIKLVIGSLYLLLGLAVLAMSFNLVQEEVVLKCKAFAHWIGLLKD